MRKRFVIDVQICWKELTSGVDGMSKCKWKSER